MIPYVTRLAFQLHNLTCDVSSFFLSKAHLSTNTEIKKKGIKSTIPTDGTTRSKASPYGR